MQHDHLQNGSKLTSFHGLQQELRCSSSDSLGGFLLHVVVDRHLTFEDFISLVDGIGVNALATRSSVTFTRYAAARFTLTFLCLRNLPNIAIFSRSTKVFYLIVASLYHSNAVKSPRLVGLFDGRRGVFGALKSLYVKDTSQSR